MRTIKKAIPEAATLATVFEKGKERQLTVILDARCLYIRARGFRRWQMLNYGTAYLHSVAADAGFDPSPRAKGGRR